MARQSSLYYLALKIFFMKFQRICQPYFISNVTINRIKQWLVVQNHFLHDHVNIPDLAILCSMLAYKIVATIYHYFPHPRSEEHTSELQSHVNLVCRLLLEKKNKIIT